MPEILNPSALRPAATILLLRDRASLLEVLMVQRHREIDFAPNAMVFPGGRVDPGDWEVARRSQYVANSVDGDESSVVFGIAAIRETFEESGVLLACRRGDPERKLLSAHEVKAIDATHRAALCRGEVKLFDILATEDILLTLDRLSLFAHWITPAFLPKRYDTKFFLAEAPPNQLATHDGTESVDSRWVLPMQLLSEHEQDRCRLVFATRLNLQKLSHFRDVRTAINLTRASQIVTVIPEAAETGTGPGLRIPKEAGYGSDIFSVDSSLMP